MPESPAQASPNPTPTASTPPAADPAATKRKWRRYAVIAGALLGLGCRVLPADYQHPCEVIASLCTGGLL